MMLMFLAGLQSIDETVLEAAKLDGVNFFQNVFYIKFPTIMPVILTAISIRMIDAARTFDIIYVMVDEQVTVISTVIYKTLVKYNHTGYASAMAMIFILFFVIFTLVFLKDMWRQSKGGK
jgi:multiple sugar transport system permease protein